MRGTWIVVALVACHHADAPAPVAPPGPTSCARASDSMVQVMLDRLPAQDAPPTETADAIRNLIRRRCEQDGWSAEATRCLIAMQRQDDALACAKLMTADQQAALVADEQAQFGGGPGRAGTAEPAPPPPPAPDAVPPAPDAVPAAREAAPERSPGQDPAPAAVVPAASAAPPPPGAPPKPRPKSGKSKGKGAAGDPCSGGE